MLITNRLKKQRRLLRPIRVWKIEIHLSAILLFCIAVALNFAEQLAVTYAVVLLHESAHLLTALRLGVKADKLEILPFGVTMRLKNGSIGSPEDELRIAAAGPISNIVMALACVLLHRYGLLNENTALYLTALNVFIALINIAPALPMDGGRMLKAYLTLQCGYIKGYNLTMLITKITAAVLIAAGLAVLAVTGFNFSLILIGAFLITNTVSEQRGKSLVLMREILYSREKLRQVGAENGGIITMLCNAPAKSALKILSYNKYYTINIVDDNMNIIGSITETRLLEGLIDKGIKIKVGELLNVAKS